MSASGWMSSPMVTERADSGASLRNVVVLSTELGMTTTSPTSVRMVVERHVMSVTTP